MKNIFEYMTTMIVSMILVFIFTSIITIGSQMLNARLIHSMAIDDIQSSYYDESIKDRYNSYLNSDDRFSGWKINLAGPTESVNSRRTYLVTLVYKIKMPLIGQYIDNLEIKGYAR